MRFPWLRLPPLDKGGSGAILLALIIGLMPTNPASAKPQRIVSMSLCADILLLYLAERRHIASVTFLAIDPRLSPIVERARGIPINYGTALAVGAAVSVSGTIGFIGLVVPHLLRPLTGYRPSILLGLSALGGAVLILLADIGVRLLSTGQELKLGVVTALLGGPFFLYLLLHLRRSLP